MNKDENIQALREAVSLSPDNIPLRKHLADSLLQAGRHEEAEKEFRETLKLDPNNNDVKYGLARVFYHAGKNKEAIVLIEETCQRAQAPGSMLLLWSKLLRREGDVSQSINAYKNAVNQDESLQDDDFEEELGIYIDGLDQESEIIEGKIRIGNNEDSQFNTEIERSNISFSNVGGMEELKETIRLQIIHPLKNPEMYKAFGKAIGGGILMYGPPGCGKTHIARAVAGEIDAAFISIGIQDVLDMWVGSSERNLHDIFESARNNKPCVLFFDEVDALAASRSDMKTSSSRQVINQFLAELDGASSNNDGLLILAATNAPWHIDTAFRRPGRFDRIIFVPPPDQIARNEIYRILLDGKPMNDIDIDHVSKKSDQFSGADIGAVINYAVEDKLQLSLKTGKIIPLVTKDLLKAAKKHKATTKEWFLTAKNHALYANQGGLYDSVIEYMKAKK